MEVALSPHSPLVGLSAVDAAFQPALAHKVLWQARSTASIHSSFPQLRSTALTLPSPRHVAGAMGGQGRARSTAPPSPRQPSREPSSEPDGQLQAGRRRHRPPGARRDHSDRASSSDVTTSDVATSEGGASSAAASAVSVAAAQPPLAEGDMLPLWKGAVERPLAEGDMLLLEVDAIPLMNPLITLTTHLHSPN